MAEIKLDDEKLQTVMQVAILEAIGPIGREAIIKQAVQEITKTTSNSYGQKEGPLWSIIRREAEKIAETIIRGKLEADAEFLAAIEYVVRGGRSPVHGGR
jgi:hypothetical protein